MTSEGSVITRELKLGSAVLTGASSKRLSGVAEKALRPDETWSFLQPLLLRIGVTRLADITGLDRIGHPVVLSIRPTSRTLSVDAGKGFTLLLAKLSAGMEALERFAAETFEPTGFRAALAELDGMRLGYDVEQLPLTRWSLFSRRKPEYWAWVRDLIDDNEYAVPSSLIGLGTIKTPGGSMFQVTSNGLAAGNSVTEALSSGLYEVIERDGIALWSLAESANHLAMKRVAHDSIAYPYVRSLLDELERVDVGVVICDCRVDTEVPVFRAILYDRAQRHVGMFKGYGAHLNPEVAMIRAITEAIQSRLVLIAASRDDMLRHTFRGMRKADSTPLVESLLSLPETVDACSIVSQSTETFEGDIAILATKLKRIGSARILAVDLTPEFASPLSVVRVLVPGLEGYRYENYSPGQRARSFLESLARS